MRTAGAVLAALAGASLAACQPLYGAGFDFPDAAPVPAGATVVATDTASDDDDPLRSRQQVLDLGTTTTQDELLAFYRDAYPVSEGWREVERSGPDQLCLVDDEDPDRTDVVEVVAWTGTRVPSAPTLRLVSVSRFERPDPDVCGLSLAWTSTDLF